MFGRWFRHTVDIVLVGIGTLAMMSLPSLSQRLPMGVLVDPFCRTLDRASMPPGTSLFSLRGTFDPAGSVQNSVGVGIDVVNTILDKAAERKLVR